MIDDLEKESGSGAVWMNLLSMVYDGFYYECHDEMRTLFYIVHTLHGCAHGNKHKKALKVLKALCRIVDKAR